MHTGPQALGESKENAPRNTRAEPGLKCTAAKLLELLARIPSGAQPAQLSPQMIPVLEDCKPLDGVQHLVRALVTIHKGL